MREPFSKDSKQTLLRQGDAEGPTTIGYKGTWGWTTRGQCPERPVGSGVCLVLPPGDVPRLGGELLNYFLLILNSASGSLWPKA